MVAWQPAIRVQKRFEIDSPLSGLEELARIAAHRVHRHYLERDIVPELLRLICAWALSAPSKSRLQRAEFSLFGKRRSLMVELEQEALALDLLVGRSFRDDVTGALDHLFARPTLWRIEFHQLEDHARFSSCFGFSPTSM